MTNESILMMIVIGGVARGASFCVAAATASSVTELASARYEPFH